MPLVGKGLNFNNGVLRPTRPNSQHKRVCYKYLRSPSRDEMPSRQQ